MSNALPVGRPEGWAGYGRAKDEERGDTGRERKGRAWEDGGGGFTTGDAQIIRRDSSESW